MLNLDGIKLVNHTEAKTIIKNRVPEGAFLEISTSGRYVAIDNTEGEAWTEDYDNLDEAILYLNVNASEGLE